MNVFAKNVYRLLVDDAVFSLLRVIELCENLSDLLGFMLPLDWMQAYDRVHTRSQVVGQPSPLLDALRRLAVPEEYLIIVDSLNDSIFFFVQARFSRSKEEPQRTGLRQGDPFSCFFFIALLTVIMHDAEEAWSAAVDPAQFSRSAKMKAIGRDHSIYADDINLLSCCLQTLQTMLHASCYPD